MSNGQYDPNRFNPQGQQPPQQWQPPPQQYPPQQNPQQYPPQAGYQNQPYQQYPQNPQYQQYNPPKPRKSRKLLVVAVVAVVAILVIAGVMAVFILPMKGTNDTVNRDTTPRILTTTAFTSVVSGLIGQAGGIISVNSTGNPLKGLKIEVPNAAAQENISFDIKYANVSSVSGLPAGASIASKMIQIGTSGSSSWNHFKLFDSLVKVTLPYDQSLVTNEKAVRFYHYDEVNHSLESTGYDGQSTANNTITFEASTFSKFVAIEVIMSYFENLNSSLSVDSGFRPATDGWYIPNYGSYLENGGVCLGMTSFAKWYFAQEKAADGTGLHSKYIEGNANEWRDDATAIQLATRAQAGLSGIWSALTQEEKQNLSSKEVGLSIMHGLLVSGEPQLIGLKTMYNNGTWADGGHAVLAYRYADGHFNIYDPNVPGSGINDDRQEMPYTYSGGFSRVFESGLTASDSLKFNIFYHAGAKVFSPNNAFKGIYDMAEKGFQGSSIFPTVKLTDASSDVYGTTPIDTNGDGIRDTTLSSATITGTITGGQSAVSSTLIFVSGQKFETPVAADGSFSQTVPLMQGDNDLVILATDTDTFSSWAGFLRDTIKSTSSPASLTLTLTWDQGSSDVDLHIKEPTINGTAGRHIYYSNKGSIYNNNPYLDLDNQQGYGPEHYFATENMTLPQTGTVGPGQPLYGTYQIRVQYYADHDSDSDNTQPITWHLDVRYLAFKNLATGQEFWSEMSYNGYLSTASSSGTSNFDGGGASWSAIYTLTYVEPVASAYGIPNPPQNSFPQS
ncbi:MAG: hypothetical protein ABR986_04300 [Methanomassiliicoccales archaeon]